MIAIPLLVKNFAGPIFSKVIDFAKSKLLGIKDSAQNNPLMYVTPIAVIVLMAFIIIPNMDSIKEKFGIDTIKSVSVKLTQEQHNTDTAIQTNEHLVEVHGIINQLGKAEDSITEELTKDIEVANTKVADINEKKNNKITKTTKDPKLTLEDKRKEISKTNIASIWDTYCSFNQESECRQAA